MLKLCSALKGFVDVDKLLSSLITIDDMPTMETIEQSINNVIMLRQFISSVRPVFEALRGVDCSLLQSIKEV